MKPMSASEAAYERMFSIGKSAGCLEREFGWSDHFKANDGSKRTARAYIEAKERTARVIELHHDNMHITLNMYSKPPEEGNYEFANIIMDAAEKIIKERRKA